MKEPLGCFRVIRDLLPSSPLRSSTSLSFFPVPLEKKKTPNALTPVCVYIFSLFSLDYYNSMCISRRFGVALETVRIGCTRFKREKVSLVFQLVSCSLSQGWRSVEPNRRKTKASMTNMEEHSRKAIRH